MQKLVASLIIGLGLLAIIPETASAAGAYNFYIRGGVITDQNFTFSPFLWTAGANLDLNLGSALVISPECDMIVYKFHFNPIWLAPAVTANFRAGGLFVGGGLAKFFIIGSGWTLSSDFLLKLNAGFKGETMKLQVYLLTPLSDEAFSTMLFGATLGFGF
jgi:hypothetical protein